MIFPTDLWVGTETEALQVLQGRDVDLHHLPRQLHAADHALQVPQELGGLPHQEARIWNRFRNWISVQLCLFATNGKPIGPILLD